MAGMQNTELGSGGYLYLDKWTPNDAIPQSTHESLIEPFLNQGRSIQE
jgi:hypothetical protein